MYLQQKRGAVSFLWDQRLFGGTNKVREDDSHAKTCNTAGSVHQRERERKGNASKTDPLFMVTIHFNGEFVGICCQTSSARWLGTAACLKSTDFRMRRESVVTRRQPAPQTMAAWIVRSVGKGNPWKVSPPSTLLFCCWWIFCRVDIELLIRMKKEATQLKGQKLPAEQCQLLREIDSPLLSQLFFLLHKRVLLHVLSKE